MTVTGDDLNGSPRLRRPKPVRTQPNRNILGAFLQNGERSFRDEAQAEAAPMTHPLGLQPDADTDPSPRINVSQDDSDIQAASDLIDRHIRDGQKYMISNNQTMWSRFSSFSDGIDTKEIAEIAKTLTRSYAEVASVWVDLAGKLREILNVQTTRETPGAALSNPIANPVVCLRTEMDVTAKVQMFQAGDIDRLQPMMPESADGGSGISDVSIDAGQLNIRIPSGTLAGRYHGLILSHAGEPLGAITLTVKSAEPT